MIPSLRAVIFPSDIVATRGLLLSQMIFEEFVLGVMVRFCTDFGYILINCG